MRTEPGHSLPDFMLSASPLLALPREVLVTVLSNVHDLQALHSLFASCHEAALLAVDNTLKAKWLARHRPAAAWRIAAEHRAQELALQLLRCTEVPGSLIPVDKDGFTPLDYATRAGFLQVLQELLPRLSQTPPGDCLRVLGKALCTAARAGNADCARIILAAGDGASFAVRYRDSGGWNSLHYACARGSPDVVAELLKVPSDLTARTPLHETALDKARASGCNTCVALLLEALKAGGPHPNCKDGGWHT